MFSSVKFEGKYEKKKIERKSKGKENVKKNKNKFKVNKLFLYLTSNSFYFFNSIIKRLNNFKILKFLTVFNHI